MSKYMCTETIDRSQFEPMQHNDVPSCGQLSDKKKNARWKTRLSVSDRLRLNVGIAGKTEIYSWVADNHFADRSLFDLVGYGSLSTGSFNNFLSMIFDSDDPEFSYNGRVLTGARSLVTDEVNRFPSPARSASRPDVSRRLRGRV